MQSLVSILIPVYNGEKSIFAAVSSCLEQNYPHIEILVLDDASTDATVSIVESFNNPKISLLKHTANQGIAHGRNTLLENAKGEYIAWLDADDTMVKERILEQVNFMQAHPEVDIAGSWIYTDQASLPVKKLPLLHHQIRTMLWFKNCIIQPSVISRNFYKEENIRYNIDFNNSAEDYELWYRLSFRKIFANIPLFLSTYHMTVEDALARKQDKHHFRKHIDKLWQQKWQDLPIATSEKDKSIFQDFLYKNEVLTAAESNAVLNILSLLKAVNTDKFFQLVISFYLLRLWKMMTWNQRIRHIPLVLTVIYYPKMKRNYLL